MSLILSQSWRENAAEDINPRGKPLPRHAVPYEVPYHSAITRGEGIAGSVIMPVCHFTGLDKNGAATDDQYTVYGQVLVSATSMRQLKDAELIESDATLYRNMDECRRKIHDLNTQAHEHYLDGYANGAYAGITDWRQDLGAAMRATELSYGAGAAPTAGQKL